MNTRESYKDFGFETPPQSYWMASTTPPEYPRLEEDLKVDVAIVGGGLVGITTAYLLKQEGVKVAIIEADKISQGTTGHTTAKVTSQHDIIYSKIKSSMGQEKAQMYADANQAAIKFIADIVDQKKIDCDFSWQSSYVFTQQDLYVKQIQDETDTALTLGLPAAYLTQIPLPLPNVKAALRFDNQAQFHPRKYILALAKEIPGDGCHIFEGTRVVDVHEGSPVEILTSKGNKIHADNVVIASHFPFYGANAYFFARQYAERSYALGVKINGKYPGGMYITAEDPGKSYRVTPFEGGELVIVGGEHHKTGQGDNMNIHYDNVRKYAAEAFEVQEILYRWSTQDYTTLDKLPYVGHITNELKNIYVATGFRKWGMTNSTASALIIKDLIVKGENPWAEVYKPSRFNAASVGPLVVENTDVAKHLIGDKLKPVPDDIDVKPGEGKPVIIDGEKIGVYRDFDGKLHKVDITCTHMGCDLHWNAAELTWDCPCHGSRFTYEGKIVEGPALRNLTTDEGRFNP